MPSTLNTTTLNISQVMTRDVTIVTLNDSLQTAAQMMRECDVGLLPVGEQTKLVGMLSDRDIAIRAVAEGLSPTEPVEKIMSAEIAYIFEDDSVEEAARYMSELQVRRLPVVNHEHQLVGIVSLGDVSLSQRQAAGEALNGISQPNIPD